MFHSEIISNRLNVMLNPGKRLSFHAGSLQTAGQGRAFELPLKLVHTSTPPVGH